MRIDNVIYESWKFLIVLFLVSIFVFLLDKSFKKSPSKNFFWKVIVASSVSFSVSFLYSDLIKTIVSILLMLVYCIWYFTKIEKQLIYPIIFIFGIAAIGLGFNILPLAVGVGVFLISVILNRKRA
jgi:hypothetical protein